MYKKDKANLMAIQDSCDKIIDSDIPQLQKSIEEIISDLES